MLPTMKMMDLMNQINYKLSQKYPAPVIASGAKQSHKKFPLKMACEIASSGRTSSSQ
jgi:hypothetical protein